MGRWDFVEGELGRLAARQYGLVARKQVLNAGGSVDLIEHRIATGRWHRSAAAVYRLSGTEITWHQRALAACLDAGTGASVSHRSAAVLWGVSGFRPARVEITVPRNRSTRSALAVVHRSLAIPKADITIRDGIPVSRPARMLVDLAGAVGYELLTEAVDDVLCRRLIPPAELLRRAHEMGGRRGSRAMRSILGAWIPVAAADGDSEVEPFSRPDNRGEMRVVRMLIAHGLPRPVCQYVILDGGRFVALVDFAYPEARLAIEFDSFRFHAGRGHFRKDRVRRNDVEAAGWRLLHATDEDVYNGDELCRVVSRLRARGAAELKAQSPTSGVAA